jgi:hypothetical protein
LNAKSSSIAFDLRCYVREQMIKFLQVDYPQCLPTRRDAVTLQPVDATVTKELQPPL